MSNALTTTTLNPMDPSELGWPPALPMELALKTAPVKEICVAYRLTREDYDRLRQDPLFVGAVTKYRDALAKDGGLSFKLKAQLQAEALLRKSWDMIHDPDPDIVPANVRADLIKFTIRAAGLDGSKDQANGAGVGNALQININLG
jgi:hypothetical protein